MEYICLIVLFLASVYDIRTMEVPLPLTLGGPAVATVLLVSRFFCGDINSWQLGSCLLGGILLFGISFIGVRFWDFGGADALLNGLVGLTQGIWGLYTVMFSFLLVLPYTFYMKIRNKEHAYPFVPYIFVAYAITMLIPKFI